MKDGIFCEGLAIRTDDLAYVTEEVAYRLVDDGLPAIIDQRSPSKYSRPAVDRSLDFRSRITTCRSSRMWRMRWQRDGPNFGHEAMGEMYVRMVERIAPNW